MRVLDGFEHAFAGYVGKKHACGRVLSTEHIVIDSAPVFERLGKRKRYRARAGKRIALRVISRADLKRVGRKFDGVVFVGILRLFVLVHDRPLGFFILLRPRLVIACETRKVENVLVLEVEQFVNALGNFGAVSGIDVTCVTVVCGNRLCAFVVYRDDGNVVNALAERDGVQSCGSLGVRDCNELVVIDAGSGHKVLDRAFRSRPAERSRRFVVSDSGYLRGRAEVGLQGDCFRSVAALSALFVLGNKRNARRASAKIQLQTRSGRNLALCRIVDVIQPDRIFRCAFYRAPTEYSGILGVSEFDRNGIADRFFLLLSARRNGKTGKRKCEREEKSKQSFLHFLSS